MGVQAWRYKPVPLAILWEKEQTGSLTLSVYCASIYCVPEGKDSTPILHKRKPRLKGISKDSESVSKPKSALEFLQTSCSQEELG